MTNAAASEYAASATTSKFLAMTFSPSTIMRSAGSSARVTCTLSAFHDAFMRVISSSNSANALTSSLPTTRPRLRASCVSCAMPALPALRNGISSVPERPNSFCASAAFSAPSSMPANFSATESSACSVETLPSISPLASTPAARNAAAASLPPFAAVSAFFCSLPSELASDSVSIPLNCAA